MKYENFEQAKKIVERIKAHESKLEELAYEAPYVRVTHRSGGSIFTIGTESDSEHEYANVGRYVVAAISVDLKERIDNLKTILEKL